MKIDMKQAASSRLKDQMIEVEIDRRLHLVRLRMTDFDSALVVDLVTEILPEEGVVACSKDDDPFRAPFALELWIAGRPYAGQVVTLAETDEHPEGRVTVTLVDAAAAEQRRHDEARMRSLVDLDPGIAQLMAAHPALFRGAPPVCHSYVRPGWLPIVDEFLAKVKVLLGPANCALFEVRQVKEKFGDLRIYYALGRTDADGVRAPHPAAEAVLQLRRAAEERAATTCEECGAAGELRTDLGWALTLCDHHHQEALDRRAKKP